MDGDDEGDGQALGGEAVLDVPAGAGEEAKLRPDQAESRFVAVLPGASAEPFARPALDPIDALFARIGE